LLIYDTSYIDSRVLRTLRDSMLTALLETILITGLALVLVRWTFLDPLRKTVTWLQHLRSGSSQMGHTLPSGEIFDEINAEVKHLARTWRGACCRGRRGSAAGFKRNAMDGRAPACKLAQEIARQAAIRSFESRAVHSYAGRERN